MRKVFYYDEAVPPKEWLIIASLLWDKIWISPIIANILSAPHLFKTFEKSFIAEVFRKLDVFDFSDPLRDKDKQLALLSDGEELEHFKKAIARYVEKYLTNKQGSWADIFELHKKADFYLKIGNRGMGLQLLKKISRIVDSKYEWSKINREITSYNHAFFNSKFKEVYVDLDYFFEQEKTFQNYWPNTNKVFMYSVKSLLPIEPLRISSSQIRDFRQKTISERFRFKNESKNMLREILQATNEKDLRYSLQRFEDVLRSELDLLEKRYADCKIKSSFMSLSIIGGIPTSLHLLCQAVHVPIYDPATIIAGLSAAGASLISSINSYRAEINKSPWGFLLSLRKL